MVQFPAIIRKNNGSKIITIPKTIKVIVGSSYQFTIAKIDSDYILGASGSTPAQNSTGIQKLHANHKKEEGEF